MAPYWWLAQPLPRSCCFAAKAAARAGAGYVTLAVPEAIVSCVQMMLPEVPVIGLPCDSEGVFTEEAAPLVLQLAAMRTVTLVGPGMRVSGGTVKVTSALTLSCPLLLTLMRLTALLA